MFKHVLGIIIILLLILPLHANASLSEQEILESLNKQILILLNEVVYLQETLLSIQNPSPFGPLPDDQTREIIGSGLNWLKNSQEDNGHFRYEYSPYSDSYSSDDHIVRQSGALYILGEAARKGVPGLETEIEKSLDFFKELSISHNYNDKSFKCVANYKNSKTCTLGTTALVIVGAIDLIETNPNREIKYKKLIDDYINFILAIKNPDAGFLGYYYANNEPQTAKESSFSNGEALLALARYYKNYPSEEVKSVIDNTFEYFSQQEHDPNLYLWVMAALKDMQDLWEKDEYSIYTKKYTDWRIGGFKHRRGSGNNMCAYIEGVISAYSVMEPTLSQQQKNNYLEEINFWLHRSKSLQVKDNDKYRIVDGKFGEILNTTRAYGGFLTGRNNLTQRIDYTQHCVSSYIQKLVDIDNKSI